MSVKDTTRDGEGFDLSALRAQQHSLRNHGRLHGVHWIILGLSVLITLAAWHFSSKLLHERSHDRFERQAGRFVNQMTVRISHYEHALLAGTAAMLTLDDNMSREQWARYASTLQLDKRYPGASGIGVIRQIPKDGIADFVEEQRTTLPAFDIKPEHDYPFSLPIVYVEPADSNAAAIGLDVAFEVNRRSAAIKARDTNTTQMSGPITLVQDAGKTPGLLFYAPYYRDDGKFAGWVYSPLVVKTLVQAVFGNEMQDMFLSIEDGESQLFDAFPQSSNEAAALRHVTEIERELYGRTWKFSLGSPSAFMVDSEAAQPTIVLMSGLTIDVLLFVLFLILTRTNRRVMSLAGDMTDKLGDQAASLTEKNAELESFAYVASHDLKTPLRAIDSLSTFLEEDIEDRVDDDATRLMLTGHLKRIDEQVERGLTLIRAVLDFSVSGRGIADVEHVDSGAVVRKIGNDLGIAANQLDVSDDLPILNTCPVRLRQVLENLIGNAIKYHPNPATARIGVSATALDGYHRFLVSDDGSGIDPQFHERVFRPFTTLSQNPDPGSSGIGLSIVRKCVESLGGSTGILTSTSQGTTFFFDWPDHTGTKMESHAHAA